MGPGPERTTDDQPLEPPAIGPKGRADRELPRSGGDLEGMIAPRPTVASSAARLANARNSCVRNRRGALSAATTSFIMVASETVAEGSASRAAARTAATAVAVSADVRTIKYWTRLERCAAGT